MPRNSYHDTPVVEFHEAFGAPVAWKPTMLDFERRKLRVSLLLEEVMEFAEACGVEIDCNPQVCKDSLSKPPDLVAAADALTDIRYVTDGACLEFGLPTEKLLREVHRSNMSKLGADGKPILREDGKILKGPNFALPDLKTILALYSEMNNRG